MAVVRNGAKLTVNWTETDLAYFAGILDGEGCFCLHSHKATRRFRGHIYSCQVHVGNTDPRLLQWIEARFGGYVHFEPRAAHQSHQKPMWRWYARADDMDRWLTAVLPFLVIKRDRAELLLAYRVTLAPHAQKSSRAAGLSSSTYPTTDAIKEKRAEIHAQLAVLNRRGATA